MEKDKKIILIIIAIIVIVVIAGIVATRWVAYETFKQVSDMVGPGPSNNAPNVTYDKNETAHTITILSIEGKPEDLLWSNVRLWNSSSYSTHAILPDGTIDAGDVISDCDGLVLLIWEPTGADFIAEEFD